MIPSVLLAQAGPLLEKLAERMVDTDPGVRSQLNSLLAVNILPELGEGALEPFLPLLMAFVCSALTQLNSDIRCTRHLTCKHVCLQPQEYGKFLI